MQTIAAAIKRAGATDTDKLIAAMQGLELMTPFGKIVYRAGDHQSTMGAYVGRLALKDGKGVMVDWRYEPGERHLPTEDEARKRRPAQ
jgi:branched-chain amino acid transport system substrate-binding protein